MSGASCFHSNGIMTDSDFWLFCDVLENFEMQNDRSKMAVV